MGMPASRPRKAKPVVMRRAERVVTVLDQRKAMTATAIPTTRACRNRPFSSRCPRAPKKRRRGGGLGASDVTAQKSFSRRRFPAAYVNCCTKLHFVQQMFHDRAREILAAERTAHCIALASDAVAGGRAFRCGKRLRRHHAFDARSRSGCRRRSRRLHAACQDDRLFGLGGFSRDPDGGPTALPNSALLRPLQEPPPRPERRCRPR